MERPPSDHDARLAAEHADRLVREIGPALLAAYPEKADRLLLKERAFAERVLDFCAQAAQNGPGTVFWDLDFALGFDAHGLDDEPSQGRFYPRPIAKPLLDLLKSFFPELEQRVLTIHARALSEADPNTAPPLSRMPAWDGFDLLDDVMPCPQDNAFGWGGQTPDEAFLERLHRAAEEMGLSLEPADAGKLLYAHRREQRSPDAPSYFIAANALADFVGPSRGLRVGRSDGAGQWRDAVLHWKKENRGDRCLQVAARWWVERLRAYNEKNEVFGRGPWSEEILERFGACLQASLKDALKTKEEVLLCTDRQAFGLLWDAAIAAGFEPLYRFPNKTVMKVGRESVSLRGGYGASWRQLFP